LDILHSTPSKQYEVIVSNPPYIGDDEKKLMDDNVLLYEPHLALFPENQPLLFYQRISEIGQLFLPSGGRLYFEMNEFYANEIAAIAKQLGYVDVTIKKDINGKDRMLRAVKS
jgi:release factor glutamine methyltransferase